MVPIAEERPEIRVCDLLEALERLLSEKRAPGSEMALIHVRRVKELVGCKRIAGGGRRWVAGPGS